MINFISRLKLYPFLLIIFISLVAYGQTLGMYIWQDDNAIMFKLGHLQEGAGNLGTGIYDKNSAFRFVIVPLIPVFYFFGINPAAYYLLGLVWFVLASGTVYLLAKALSNNKSIAFSASLIFASGFTGAETLWRIFNSSQTLITIICINLSLYFFLISKKSNHLFYYFLSLGLFALAMEIGYVRAHGIFWGFLALELLFDFKLVKSILKIFPFFIFFGHWYFFGNPNNKHIDLLLEKIFVNYQFNILLTPLKSLENVIIPDWLNFPLVLFIVLLMGIFIKYKDKLLLWSVIFIIGNFATYFFIYNDAILESTHRYLTISSVGGAIFWAILSGRIANKKFNKILIALIVIIHLVSINFIQWNHLNEKSFPARNFYSVLKKEIKKLPSKSAIYFDVYEDRAVRERFEDFFNVGSMPNSTAVAIHFNIDRDDVYLPKTYLELLNLIKDRKIDKNNIYTFFYNREGNLINTTENTKKSLYGNVVMKKFDNSETGTGSSSPLQIKMDIDMQIKDDTSGNGKEKIDVNKYLEYFVSREKYYKYAIATSSSDWKYQEIKNINDNNLYTSWMANRVNWHYNSNEDVIIDLGEAHEIGGAKITFGPSDKTPTNYSYFCSNDKANWEKWKQVYFFPRSHAEVKFDSLNPKICRFVKINFTDTVNHDAPVIAELEIIDSRFANLNLNKAGQFFSNPFSFAFDKSDVDIIKSFINTNGIPAKICFYTDKFPVLDDRSCNPLTLNVGSGKIYTTFFPPQGTVLSKIQIVAPSSIFVKVNNIKISNLTFMDIYDKGLINILK